LEGFVGEAIVNLWLYFYHRVQGVAYNIIPLKSIIIEKNVGYNVIPPTPLIINFIDLEFPASVHNNPKVSANRKTEN